MALVVKLTRVLAVQGSGQEAFPPRQAFLHPEAAQAFREVCAYQPLSVIAMLRGAEESMQACADHTGSHRPGYSAHNYGLAVDLDVDDCLRRFGMVKRGFDRLLSSYGWWCYRQGGRRGVEDWHYTYLGRGAQAEPLLALCEGVGTTAQALEAKLVSVYGEALKLNLLDAQIALARLHLYHGLIDGELGPVTTQALRAFQRAWRLPESGLLCERTERTLVLVAAEWEEVKDADQLSNARKQRLHPARDY